MNLGEIKMARFIPVIAAVISLAVSYVLGFLVIPYLHKLKFGQTILDIGPKWHKSKQGTPTMGGVLIVLGTLMGVILSLGVAAVLKLPVIDELKNPVKLTLLVAGIGLSLGMGLIGFIDDYIKVVKKRNLGLTARQKTIMQFLVSAAYLSSLALSGMQYTWIPFIGNVDIMHIINSIGTSLDFETARALVSNLCGYNKITERESKIILSSMSESVLPFPAPIKNEIRSRAMKNILINLI